MNQTIVLIVGSAAVGAAVSSVLTVIGQILEGRARRKELLFSKAIEMGQSHVSLLKDVAAHSRRTVNLLPTIVYARWHCRQLVALYNKGELTENMERLYEDDITGPTGNKEI